MLLNETLLRVIEQAVHTTTEGITISDARHPNNALVYANPAFYDMTGYSPEETIGYNCRFLQGPDTDQDAVDIIRRALAKNEECVVELLNYRKDGSPFWNRLSIVPVFDDVGTLTHFVGIQSDFTVVKEADKAKAQLAAMRSTMQTVNDVVRNFMSNIDYFRFQLQASSANDPEMLELYESSVENTLEKLTALSSAQEYREREILRGIMGIDLEAIQQPATSDQVKT